MISSIYILTRSFALVLALAISFQGITQGPEWIFADFEDSSCNDAVHSDGNTYFLVSRLLTSELTHQLQIVEINTDEDMSVVYESTYQHSGTEGIGLFKVKDKWIIGRYSHLQESRDSVHLTILDDVFNYLASHAFPTVESPEPMSSVLRGDILEIYGSRFDGAHLDSMYRIQLEISSDSIIDYTQFTTSPGIRFPTSIIYDSLTSRYLVHNLFGIATLDSSFQVIRIYQYEEVQTQNAGDIIADSDNYFVVGQSRSSNLKRQLVVHMYDTSLNILKSDSLGWTGKNNYPFTRDAIIASNGDFFVGGMLDFQFLNGALQRNTIYVVAKYSSDLDQIWRVEHGGDRPYFFTGLVSDGQGGIYAYGRTRATSTSGSPNAYIVHLDSNGELLTSNNEPTNQTKLDFTIQNPGRHELVAYLNSLTQAEVIITIFTPGGRKLMDKPLNYGRNAIPMDDLPNGLYPYYVFIGDTYYSSGIWIRQ